MRVKDFLAAGQGIEPRSTVPETVVLPLHHPAIASAVALERLYCNWTKNQLKIYSPLVVVVFFSVEKAGLALRSWLRAFTAFTKALNNG